MSFTNPNFRQDNKKINNEIKEESKQEVKENIILLDDIMNETDKKDINIEYTEYPRNTIITGVPRNTFLSLEQLGKLTIKYENSLDNVNKTL